MIAANDDGNISFLTEMAPDQLRSVIAHAGGLLAFACGEESAARTLCRVADRLLTPKHKPAEWLGVKQSLSREVRDAVIGGVSAETGISPAEILGDCREKPVYRARALAMYRLREIKRDDGLPKYSFPAIGRAFGRDHTTVMHAYRKVRLEVAAKEQGRAA